MEKRAVIILTQTGSGEYSVQWGIANIQSFDGIVDVDSIEEAIHNVKYRSPLSKEYKEKLKLKQEEEHFDWLMR